MVVSPNEEHKKTSKFDIIWLCLYAVCICLLCILVVHFCVQRTIVDGSSMETTLQDGDNALVNKLSYTFAGPKRFDVVVFDYDKTSGSHYIKRIIGLPGETVQIIDGYVYIDGEKLTEDVYGKDVMTYAGIAAEAITLGEGEYFVLGDNRNESSDSRYADVGVVHKEQIIGKAWLRILPFSSFGTIK
ncbi:MAG: signal peptidase I [Lachnospiraceae bacterium]|nr:signal peptidase I [Lachnospiraceae bacterium]